MALAVSPISEALNDYGMLVYSGLWRGTLELIVVPMHTTWWCNPPSSRSLRSKSPLTISLRSTNLPLPCVVNQVAVCFVLFISDTTH